MKLPTDKGFNRTTTPELYAAYKDYIQTGKYPYLDDVTEYIASKYSIADKEQLRHEMYLASSMYSVERNQALEQELRGLGFTPITDWQFREGQKIIVQGITTPLRVVKDGNGGWFGFPPRHKRTGYNLTAKLQQHNAYLQDVKDGREGMRGGKVVMVKEATA